MNQNILKCITISKISKSHWEQGLNNREGDELSGCPPWSNSLCQKRSNNLAPSDFCLFPKLRGCRYERIEEMKEAVTKFIDTLTQEDFHEALKKLLERCNKCITAINPKQTKSYIFNIYV